MSQDTWLPSGGTEVAVDDLVRLWREAIDDGADGLTVSGGEPLQQPVALREFLLAADEARSGSGREADILVYTGYEETELDAPMLAAVELADVLVTGRFEVSRPTSLSWRGSANQRMVLRTDLARRRYGAHVDASPERPPIQVSSDANGVWLIGIPRRGTLTELERGLRKSGLGIEDVSWRR